MNSSNRFPKILYLLNQRFPTEKAYGRQVAKTCEALAGTGAEVILVSPYRRNRLEYNTVFDYYGIQPIFKFKRTFSPDLYLPGALRWLSFHIKNSFSALVIAIYALFSDADIIYSRDEAPLWFLGFFKKNIIYECHKFTKRKDIFYRRLKKKDLKFIVISKGLKDVFVKKGFNPENILIVHDGVDLNEFDVSESTEDARRRLGLPLDKKIIGYVGHLRTLGMEKGISDLLAAVSILGKELSDLSFVAVGGSEKDIEYYKEAARKSCLKDFKFVGQRPHSEIPFYLKSFDVLVMPFPYNEHYAFYMSPLKLFEYMASKRPIVSTDLPSVREILNENNSVLVKPGSPERLAQGIKSVLDNEETAERLAGRAFEDVKSHTWEERASMILRFIEHGKKS